MSKNRGKKDKKGGGMAGDVLQQGFGKGKTKGMGKSEDVARGAMLNRKDWSIPNWDNPSKKEMKKFEKATGYPQYLEGFKEDQIQNMYKDQNILWYSEGDSYNETMDNLATGTGLNFTRVPNQDDAEIINMLDRGEEKIVERFDRNLTNNTPDSLDKYGATLPNYGELAEGKAGPSRQYDKALGYSTDFNVSKDHGHLPAFAQMDDYVQFNRSLNVSGEDLKTLGYGRPFKGAEFATQLGGDYNKMAAQTRRHTMEHEVGHSMGIAGDLTLNKKDPSPMSYNASIRTGVLGEREYESIKKNFQPYINDAAYKPYVAPVPYQQPAQPQAAAPGGQLAAAFVTKSRAKGRKNKKRNR